MNKNRFLQVLRWELLLGKRQIANSFLASFTLIVIPQILVLIVKPSYDSTVTMGILCAIGLCAYIVLCGSFIFSRLRSRQQRINNFMLPASNSEKFIARYLMLILATPLAAIAGFLAGDLVQHLLTMAFGAAPALWALTSLNDFFSNLFNAGPAVIDYNDLGSIYGGPWAFALGLIAQHAVFLFFGSLFHKHPLVMGILSWMALNMLILTVVSVILKQIFDLVASDYSITLYDSWWLAIGYAVNIAITVFCYWFAYRRYTRLQVINNQWINK